jgi:hypothetical protein
MNTQTENKEKTLAEELSEAKSEANAEANKETRKDDVDEPRRMRLSVVISPSRSIRSPLPSGISTPLRENVSVSKLKGRTPANMIRLMKKAKCVSTLKKKLDKETRELQSVVSNNNNTKREIKELTVIIRSLMSNLMAAEMLNMIRAHSGLGEKDKKNINNHAMRKQRHLNARRMGRNAPTGIQRWHQERNRYCRKNRRIYTKSLRKAGTRRSTAKLDPCKTAGRRPRDEETSRWFWTRPK